MAQLGDVAVLAHRDAARAGRWPIGRIESGGRSAILFGLPGNPVAVMVTFYAFVRDALLAMSGAAPTPLLAAARARASSAMRKKPGRTEYQRGIVDARRRRPLAGAR